jgi:uncharacterized membrane protein
MYHSDLDLLRCWLSTCVSFFIFLLYALGCWHDCAFALLLTLTLVASAVLIEWLWQVNKSKSRDLPLSEGWIYAELPEGLRRLCPASLLALTPNQIFDNRGIAVFFLSLVFCFWSWLMPIPAITLVISVGMLGQGLGWRYANARCRHEYKVEQKKLAERKEAERRSQENWERLDRAWPQLDCAKPDADGYVSVRDIERERLLLGEYYCLHLVDNGCRHEFAHGLNLKGDPEKPNTMRIHVDNVEELVRRYHMAMEDRSSYCPGYFQEVPENKLPWRYC